MSMRILAVTNMYPTPEAPANGVFVEEQIKGLRARGLHVEVLFLNRRREGPLVYYRMEPLLRGALEAFLPDIIHVMYGGVLAAQVTAGAGLPPVVVTFHGSDLLGENLSGPARKIISRYGVHCSRKAARRAKGVVVVASHLLAALGRGVDRAKVRVIPCGIDLDRFKPSDRNESCRRLGWRTEDFHILFASNMGDPVKRPHLALAAAERLGQERTGVRFHLLSGVPNIEVPLRLNASDVLLLTSRHEGSPTIVKEALACGLPIVSVPVGDVAERIASVAGCHLAGPDPTDLAWKLDLVYRDRQRLDCREKLEGLSCEAVAAQLEQFYRELAPAAGRNRAGDEARSPLGVGSSGKDSSRRVLQAR